MSFVFGIYLGGIIAMSLGGLWRAPSRWRALRLACLWPIYAGSLLFDELVRAWKGSPS